MKLRKYMYTIVLISIAVFSFIGCKAENISQYLNGQAVNVIESEDSIDIYALISFYGEITDDYVPDTQITYYDAFMQAVESMWSGTYQDKAVNVHLQQVPDDVGYKHVKIIWDKVRSTDNYCCTQKSINTIYMYTGDGRVSLDKLFSYDDLMYTAGHEFGHILGLFDVYRDECEEVRDNLRSPMNGWDALHAIDDDYYVMLNNRTWELSYTYHYSNDELIFKKYQLTDINKTKQKA